MCQVFLLGGGLAHVSTCLFGGYLNVWPYIISK